MKGALLFPLLLVLAQTACGPSQDQEARQRLLAAAIQAADRGGVAFSMQERITVTGGAVPPGLAEVASTQASGSLKKGAARMRLQTLDSSGHSRQGFQLLKVDSELYVRAAQGPWKTAPAGSAAPLFPAILLGLLRETVLFSRSTSPPAAVHLGGGFTHQYRVRPAADQIEQLAAVPAPASGAADFLKTPRAEVDVFLSAPGERLVRMEVHLADTDPQSGTMQKVDAGADFKPVSVGRVLAPPDAVSVAPAELFQGGSATSSGSGPSS